MTAIDKFLQEFSELLVKHQIGTYFLGVVVHNDTSADVPVLLNVTGDKARGITPPHLSARFIDALLGGVLRLLMQYNGLTLPQALGAVQESIRCAADEVAEQLDAKREMLKQADSMPDA